MSEQAYVAIGTASDTTLTVTRVAANPARPQGLVFDADHPLTVGTTAATRVVLWSDTAPPEVEILTTGAGELRIWNAWRDEELTQAWVGHSHIEVDDDADDLGLRCHDGHPDGAVDLEVRISFDRAWTQPGD